MFLPKTDSMSHAANPQESFEGKTIVYFAPAQPRRSVRFFDFQSRRTRTIFEMDNDLGYGLSVSPDGRWILYSQAGEPTGDIMLVDHFR